MSLAITSPGAVVSTGGPTLTVAWTPGLTQASYRASIVDSVTSATVFDTGWVTDAVTTSLAINCPQAGILTDTSGGRLLLQVWARDVNLVTSTATLSFDVQWGVVTAAITGPSANASVTSNPLLVLWSFASTRGFPMGSYRLKAYLTGTGALAYDSGSVPSAAVSAPLAFVLSDASSYTLGLILTNTMGVSSPEVQVRFVTNMVDPPTYPLEPRVGSLYSVAINGQGLMMGDDPTNQDYRYREVVVPLELTRFASGVAPFEEAIEHYLFAGLYSWVDGAGQTHHDRPEASATRYLDSDGVNPFLPNQLTLLHPMAKTIGWPAFGPNSPVLVTGGGILFMQTSTTEVTYVTSLSDAVGTTVSWPAQIQSMTTDGTSTLYASCVDHKVYQGFGTPSVFSAPGAGLPSGAQFPSALTWAGQRLCLTYRNASGNAVFTTLNQTGVEEVVNGRLVLPSGWTITGIAGGNAGHVWISASSGTTSAIYKWDLSTATPSLALDLPSGEYPTSVFYYQGNLMIASAYVMSDGNHAFRIYRSAVDASTGNLTPQLVVDAARLGVDAQGTVFGAFRDQVFWSWPAIDGSNYGMGCLDLSIGGYTKWLKANVAYQAAEAIGGIVPFQGAMCMSVGSATPAGGMFVEQLALYRSSGSITSSIIDKQSALQKVWEQVLVLLNAPLNAGESLLVEYSLDNGTTWNTLSTASLTFVGQRFAQAPLSRKSNSIQFRITLSGPGTSSPNLQILTTRVRQTGVADLEVQIPIDCRDEVHGLNGQMLPEAGPNTGMARLRWLQSLAQTRIAFQGLDWLTTQQVGIFDVASVDAKTVSVYDPSQGKVDTGGIAVLTLRAVAK